MNARKRRRARRRRGVIYLPFENYAVKVAARDLPLGPPVAATYFDETTDAEVERILEWQRLLSRPIMPVQDPADPGSVVVPGDPVLGNLRIPVR